MFHLNTFILKLFPITNFTNNIIYANWLFIANSPWYRPLYCQLSYIENISEYPITCLTSRFSKTQTFVLRSLPHSCVSTGGTLRFTAAMPGQAQWHFSQLSTLLPRRRKLSVIFTLALTTHFVNLTVYWVVFAVLLSLWYRILWNWTYHDLFEIFTKYDIGTMNIICVFSQITHCF